MKKLGLMLQFFTRIPLPFDCDYSEENFKKGLYVFPIIGIIIGLLLALVGYLIPMSPVRGIILTLIYLVVSGGLHLDGFADTYDGVYSGRSKERKLEIMKDPNVGSFGAIALIMIIVSYVYGFQSMPLHMLIVVPFAARAIAQAATHGQVYARKEGMGQWFVTASPTLWAMMQLLLTILILFYFGMMNLVIMLLVMIIWVNIRRMNVVKALGGLTGDVIGFFIEEAQMIGIITMLVLEIV